MKLAKREVTSLNMVRRVKGRKGRKGKDIKPSYDEGRRQ